MSDPHIRQFNTRLKKIDRIHRKGGGFEAKGTLGQSYYTRKARRAARPILGPAIGILAIAIMVKAVAAANLPAEEYDARVASLRDGSVLERALAYVMAPDPVSQTAARLIAPLIPGGAGAPDEPPAAPSDV